jgi:hypothetical protein
MSVKAWRKTSIRSLPRRLRMVHERGASLASWGSLGRRFLGRSGHGRRDAEESYDFSGNRTFVSRISGRPAVGGPLQVPVALP